METMSLRNWEAVGALGHNGDFGRCDCLELRVWVALTPPSTLYLGEDSITMSKAVLFPVGHSLFLFAAMALR